MTQRSVEVFTAGCPLCDETVKLVQELACDSCDIQVRDLREGHIYRMSIATSGRDNYLGNERFLGFA